MNASISKVSDHPKTNAKIIPTPRLLIFWSIVPIRIPVAWKRTAEPFEHSDRHVYSLLLAHPMLPLRDEYKEHPCCFLIDRNKPLLAVVKVERFSHAVVLSVLHRRWQRENSKVTMIYQHSFSNTFGESDHPFAKRRCTEGIFTCRNMVTIIRTPRPMKINT